MNHYVCERLYSRELGEALVNKRNDSKGSIKIPYQIYLPKICYTPIMIKIFITLILSSLMLFASPSPQRKAAAMTMLTAMNKNKNMDRLIANMIKMQVLQNPLLRMHEQKVTKFFLKHTSFQKMKSQLALLYAKELTIPEMRTFTAFCKTKEGQRILLKMPRLLQLSTNLGERNIQKHYPELIQSLMR